MVRRKCIQKHMRTEASREFARSFHATNHWRTRRTHPPLHAGRESSPLGRRLVLYLLSVHRTRLLVPLHVLAGSACRRRTDGAFLASLVWPGLHCLDVLDVQDVAGRHGYHRRGPALEEGDQTLHRERRSASSAGGPIQLWSENILL